MKTTAYHLGRYILHLLLLKSSVVAPMMKRYAGQLPHIENSLGFWSQNVSNNFNSF